MLSPHSTQPHLNAAAYTHTQSQSYTNTPTKSSAYNHVSQSSSQTSTPGPSSASWLAPLRLIAQRRFSYNVSLDMSGNWSLVTATLANGQPLPPWLRLELQLIGQYTIPNTDWLHIVHLNGTIAFLATHTGILILDVSQPVKPTFISKVEVSGGVEDFALLIGDKALALTSYNAVYLLDLHDLHAPAVLAQVLPPVPNRYLVAIKVTRTGETLLLLDSGLGLLIFDIRNATHPQSIYNFTFLNCSNYNYYSGLEIDSRNLAYVATSCSVTLIDISNTSRPLVVSTVVMPTSVGTIVVSGTLVVASRYRSFVLIDVSNPSDAKELGSFQGFEYIIATLVVGNIVIVKDFPSTLLFVDIADPSHPRLFNAASTPSGGSRVLALSGQTIFTGEFSFMIFDFHHSVLTGTPSFSSAFQQFDVKLSTVDVNVQQSDNDHLLSIFIDRPPLTILNTLLDVSVLPDHHLSLNLNSQLLFTNPSSVFLTPSLQVRGYANPPEWMHIAIQPVLYSEFITSSTSDTFIAISGTLLALFNSSVLLILDITNPNQLQLLHSLPMHDVFQATFEESGSFLYVLQEWSLIILEFSSNGTPNVLSNFSMPIVCNKMIQWQHIVFCADDLNILIVNTSNSSFPQLISNMTSGFLWISSLESKVSESLLIVCDAFLGIVLVDVSDLYNPRAFLNYSSDFSFNPGCNTARAGSTVFVTDYQKLFIVDISDHTHPRTLNIVKAIGTGSFDKLFVYGSTLFVSDPSGMMLYDVQNSSAPLFLSEVRHVVDRVVQLLVAGTFMYVVDQISVLSTFDLSQWKLDITSPPSMDVGNYVVSIVAADYFSGVAVTDSFTVRVEGPPRFSSTIPMQYAKVGRSFVFFLQQGLCTDPNFDTMMFNASLSDGPLPQWLKFNSLSASFSGTPGDHDVGSITVIVEATDNTLVGIARISFPLCIMHLPIVATPIPPIPPLRVGREFNVSVPPATFSQPDSQLSYELGRSDGEPLPDWITFDCRSLILTGTPPAVAIGRLSLHLTAIDRLNESAVALFSISVYDNRPPWVAQALSDQSATVNEPFRFLVPRNTFEVFEGDGKLFNTSSLPPWLQFKIDGDLLELSGTPARSDTDAFNPRRVVIDLYVYNTPLVDGSYAKCTFSVSVNGISWVVLALSVFGPIFSALGVIWAMYRNRALVLNRLQRRLIIYMREPVIAVVGHQFAVQLLVSSERVHDVRVFLSSSLSQRPFLRHFRRSLSYLPGQLKLPSWMEYDHISNMVRSKNVVPTGEHSQLTLQVRDKADVIIEEFNINVNTQSTDTGPLSPFQSEEISVNDIESVNMVHTGGSSDARMEMMELRPHDRTQLDSATTRLRSSIFMLNKEHDQKIQL